MRKIIQAVRDSKLNTTSDFEEPETMAYLQALQDVEEKFDS